MRAGEVAIPSVAAGALTRSGHRVGAWKVGQRARVEAHPHAATLGHLVGMPEQAEPGHVRDRVRSEEAEDVRGVLIERPHPRHGLGQLVVADEAARDSVEHEPGAERLRQEKGVAGLRIRLRPQPTGMDGADDGEAVLGLVVPKRVPAREQGARFAYAQVACTNTASLALNAGLGLTERYRYRYLLPA